ncbi:MAG: hypothetical protein JSS66_14055 [Armatimonadetes bacterium]|nr:hypothetical protein [Armatimonadota bacterium]
MRSNLLCLACALGFAVGCGGQGRLMPLDKGSHWTYSVQTDFDTFVDDVRVTRRVPVGPVEGWEVKGSMGVSSLGWSGDTLIAVQLNGQRFEPPLPLLSGKGKTWQGLVRSGGRTEKCSANLSVAPVKETVGGRQVDGVMSTIALVGGPAPIELKTVFVADVGIVRQEQRSGDRRQRRLDYLTGP